MDVFDLLEQLGQVDPVDPAVLDRATREFFAQLDEPARTRRIHHGRGTWWFAGMAGAAAVAVAILLVQSSGPQPTAPRPAAAPPSSKRPEVSLRTAILTAFDARADDILYVQKLVTGDGPIANKVDIWYAPAEASSGQQERYNRLTFSSGNPVSDVWISYTASKAGRVPATPNGCGMVLSPAKALPPPVKGGTTGEAVAVQYGQKSWWKGKVGITPAQFDGPAQIRSALASGQSRVVDRGLLDGHAAIKLAVCGNAGDYLWIDARTYLPVQAVNPGVNGATFTFIYQFLPPTAANLSRLAPRIPAGYTKIDGTY